MMALMIASLFVLPLGYIWSPSLHSMQIPETLDGNWAGEYQVQGKRVYVNAGFKTEKEGIKAVLVAPLEDSARQPLTQVSLRSSVARFELTRNSETLIFEGRLKDGMISGEIQQGELRGTFQMIRVGKDDPKIHDQYVGDYQVNSIDLLVIGRTLSQLYYYDPTSGRTGILLPFAENIYFGGPSSGIHFPVDIKVTFIKNNKGEATGLSVSRNGSPEELARKVKRYNKEEISFRNGEITLSGTLRIPSKPGAHPAIVRIVQPFHFGVASTRLIRWRS